MTTEERLLNVGWKKLSHFAELMIFGRNDLRILYEPRTESIERVYNVKEFTTRLLELRQPTPLDLLEIFNEVKK
jgi:hypothetical protein